MTGSLCLPIDDVSGASIDFDRAADFLELSAAEVEILPLQSIIENIADEADLEDVYDTERHLLYVACTRARDRLLVTGVDLGSEFLDDLLSAGERGSVGLTQSPEPLLGRRALRGGALTLSDLTFRFCAARAFHYSPMLEKG